MKEIEKLHIVASHIAEGMPNESISTLIRLQAESISTITLWQEGQPSGVDGSRIIQGAINAFTTSAVYMYAAAKIMGISPETLTENISGLVDNLYDQIEVRSRYIPKDSSSETNELEQIKKTLDYVLQKQKEAEMRSACCGNIKEEAVVSDADSLTAKIIETREMLRRLELQAAHMPNDFLKSRVAHEPNTSKNEAGPSTTDDNCMG